MSRLTGRMDMQVSLADGSKHTFGRPRRLPDFSSDRRAQIRFCMTMLRPELGQEFRHFVASTPEADDLYLLEVDDCPHVDPSRLGEVTRDTNGKRISPLLDSDQSGHEQH